MEIHIPENIINIMMHAITSVETNVKWNVARSDYFQPQCGIQQGDPMSPYTFVLCMERESHLILEEANDKRWRSMWMGKKWTMYLAPNVCICFIINLCPRNLRYLQNPCFSLFSNGGTFMSGGTST